MGRIRPAALLARSKNKPAPPRRLPFDLCTLFALTLGLLVVIFVAVLYFRKGAALKLGLAKRAANSSDVPGNISQVTGAFNAGRKGLTRTTLDAQYPRVLIRTTMGDIVVELFAKDCPKTVENFLTHARRKYYENVKFHRVIRNFMIQGGDPSGDGTGGESVWGGTFEDEIRSHLKHTPFTLSMANAGKDTNGSQFFITTVATPHLDGHHTVFGTVIRGKDVVKAIESVQTDGRDAPLQEVRILETVLDPELCC